MLQNYSYLNKQVSFLVLDYNKPAESLLCLQSIRQNIKFDKYEVIFWSNGGEQNYLGQFYQEGLIDRLVVNKNNDGCGFATMSLWQMSRTKYSIYLQNDGFLKRTIDQEELNKMINALEQSNIGCLDFAGINTNVFCERAFMMKTDLYNSNPNQVGGGPKSIFELDGLTDTEQTTAFYIRDLNKQVVTWFPTLLGNAGKYTIKELPCGGIYKQRCDTQQLAFLVLPKQRWPAPRLTDEEWELVLSGKWKNFSVPDYNKGQEFQLFGPPDEIY